MKPSRTFVWFSVLVLLTVFCREWIEAWADGYLPQAGWSCEGMTTSRIPVTLNVIYHGMQGGQSRYQIRLIEEANGSVPRRVRFLIDPAQESQTDSGFIAYQGQGEKVSVQLLIRRVSGSENHLRATFKIAPVSGEIEMIQRLWCDRTHRR